ncbi:hypothetical protein A0J61_08390 [Choanephora cucurbitarum]|uniref:CAP-Gly domain-containing protein n=1 Tax=Choanephora cucurbitarum TaxID=101091 RepID=A0A1C7N4K7_9FUNG|nr:hypothetical protein A0J61_08390 [Choanephora cucurbitarum]
MLFTTLPFGSAHNVIITLAPYEHKDQSSSIPDSSTKTVPEKTHWSCHKDVLRSSSNYFNAIFSSQFQEAEASVIFLPRGIFSASVLDNIIHFMYFKHIKDEFASNNQNIQQLRLLQSSYLAADYLGINDLCSEIKDQIIDFTHGLSCYCESCSLLVPQLLAFTGPNQQNDPNLNQITGFILKLLLQDPEKALPSYWSSESMAHLLSETNTLHSYLESKLLENIVKNNAIETLHGCYLSNKKNHKKDKHWSLLVDTQGKAQQCSSKLLANNFDFYCTKYPKLLPCVDGITYSSDFLEFLINNVINEINDYNAVSLYDGIVRSLMCRDTVQRTPTVKQILHNAKSRTIRYIALHLEAIKKLGTFDKNLIELLAQDLMIPTSMLIIEEETRRKPATNKKPSPSPKAMKNISINTNRLRSRLCNAIFGQASSNFKVNQRVQLTSRLIPTFGTVKYVGKLDNNGDGRCLGIELDKSVGSNDGSINGKRYFQTSSNRGIFVKPSQVALI